MLAYCYRSGEIEFKSGKCPEGALPLVRDRSKLLVEKVVTGAARLAYDGKTWLVPGVPEADSENEALVAYQQFRRRVTSNLNAARDQRS